MFVIEQWTQKIPIRLGVNKCHLVNKISPSLLSHFVLCPLVDINGMVKHGISIYTAQQEAYKGKMFRN